MMACDVEVALWLRDLNSIIYMPTILVFADTGPIEGKDFKVTAAGPPVKIEFISSRWKEAFIVNPMLTRSLLRRMFRVAAIAAAERPLIKVNYRRCRACGKPSNARFSAVMLSMLLAGSPLGLYVEAARRTGDDRVIAAVESMEIDPDWVIWMNGSMRREAPIVEGDGVVVSEFPEKVAAAVAAVGDCDADRCRWRRGGVELEVLRGEDIVFRASVDGELCIDASMRLSEYLPERKPRATVTCGGWRLEDIAVAVEELSVQLGRYAKTISLYGRRDKYPSSILARL